MGSLALGIAGLASAQEVVNIVGSTAFRTYVTEAEVTLASHTSTGAATPADCAYVESAFASNGSNGGNHSLVHGFLSNGTEVFYRNYWTGSASGCTDVAAGTADAFIPTTAGRSAYTSGGTAFVPGSYDNEVPNATMSDCDYTDAAAVIAGVDGATASAMLTAAWQDGGVTAGSHNAVALVTFEWIMGNIGSNPVPFTNITSQQASALVAHGIEPLSFFTGNTSDVNNYVVMIGRNEDSGTRILTFAESQSGGGITTAAASAAIGQSTNQYELRQAFSSGPTGYTASGTGYYLTNQLSSASVGTGINGFKAWPKSWPLNTESTYNWNTTGHSGYNGGSDVKAVLGTPNPVTTTGWSVANAPSGFTVGTSTCYFVSCMGCNDAAGVVSGNPLTYNGVAYSKTNTSNIASGQYTLWNYEHLYYLTAASGSQVAIGSNQTAADALADAIYGTPTSTLAPVGVQLSDLKISRTQTAGTAPQ
jgi:hypothetical protein